MDGSCVIGKDRRNKENIWGFNERVYPAFIGPSRSISLRLRDWVEDLSSAAENFDILKVQNFEGVPNVHWAGDK